MFHAKKRDATPKKTTGNGTLQQKMEELLSLSHADSELVKLFLTSLCLPENNLERIKNTTLDKLLKKAKNSHLGTACTAFATQFYTIKPQEAAIEYIKTSLQNFSTLMQASLSTPKKNEAPAPGILTPSMLVSFATIEEIRFFLIKTHPDIYQRLLLVKAALSGDDVNSDHQSLAGVKNNSTLEERTRNIENIYRFLLPILTKINILRRQQPEPQINTLCYAVLMIIKDLFTFVGTEFLKWPEAVEIHEGVKKMLCHNAYENVADSKKGEVADVDDMITSTLARTMSGHSAKQELKPLAAMAGYISGEPFKNERKFFTAIHLVLQMQYTQARNKPEGENQTELKALSEEALNAIADILQLYCDLSGDYKREIFQRDIKAIHTLSMTITDLLQHYKRKIAGSASLPDLKSAQRSLLLLARFAAIVEGVKLEGSRLTPQLTTVVAEVFPKTSSSGLFEVSCLTYHELEEKTAASAKPAEDLAAFFKKQDEALEPFFAQCEAEDKALQEALLKEKEQAKKRKKNKAREAAKAGKSKIDTGSSKAKASADASDKFSLLVDETSAQGKLYRAAGKCLLEKRYAEAETGYQQAIEKAMKAQDPVMVTASILELAECLIGQASKKLNALKATLVRGETKTTTDCKEILATIVLLYEKASLEAEKSLQYCADNLQESKAVDSITLKQVEHLTRAIKTVLENANTKLQETLRFVEGRRISLDKRLQRIAEERQRVKERMGPLWTQNPAPKNHHRSIQVKAEFSQTACLEVRPGLEKLASLVLLPTLESFRLLHPPKTQPLLAAPHQEDEKALVLRDADTSAFMDRIKKMVLRRTQSMSKTESLGQWTAEGNHGLLAGLPSLARHTAGADTGRAPISKSTV